MNDVSDDVFEWCRIGDSENSKSCEGTPFSNVLGNEAEICDGQLKGKFKGKWECY